MTNISEAFSPHLIPILQRVSPERLQKAVAGIVSGEYRVTVTQQTDQEVHGVVANENGQEYRCSIMTETAACSCKDAQYRQVICKHIVALALAIIRPRRPRHASHGRNPTALRLVWSRPTLLQHERGWQTGAH
jgi:hypothetical protein